jgi:hypothetical protein
MNKAEQLKLEMGFSENQSIEHTTILNFIQTNALDSNKVDLHAHLNLSSEI